MRDVLNTMEKTQAAIQDALVKMGGDVRDLCLAVMSLTNAYVEVHKKDHPAVANFHLSQSQ